MSEEEDNLYVDMPEEDFLSSGIGINMTFSANEEKYLAILVEKLGSNQRDVIRRGLVLLAEKEGITLPPRVFMRRGKKEGKGGGNPRPKREAVTVN